jgi:hypothetical protein
MNKLKINKTGFDPNNIFRQIVRLFSFKFFSLLIHCSREQIMYRHMYE